MLTPRALIVPLFAVLVIAALPRPAVQTSIATCGVTTSATARSTSDARAAVACALPNDQTAQVLNVSIAR